MLVHILLNTTTKSDTHFIKSRVFQFIFERTSIFQFFIATTFAFRMFDPMVITTSGTLNFVAEPFKVTVAPLQFKFRGLQCYFKTYGVIGYRHYLLLTAITFRSNNVSDAQKAKP